MRTIGTWMLAIVLGLAMTEGASAETKVQLTDVHICCGACVKGIQKAVDGLNAKVDIDRDGGSVKVDAPDDVTAQKVVDAIAVAGYHGTSDHKTIKMKDGTVPAGNVKRLALSGIHNCCQGCTNAIRDAVKGVPGIKDDTLKNRATEFVIEGDFSAAEVVKALYAAGFPVKVAN